MKTTITVGQSVQVINIGQPEYWNKISVSREYDGDIDEQHEIDNVLKVVEAAHQRHSQSMTNYPSRDIVFKNVTTGKTEY